MSWPVRLACSRCGTVREATTVTTTVRTVRVIYFYYMRVLFLGGLWGIVRENYSTHCAGAFVRGM